MASGFHGGVLRDVFDASQVPIDYITNAQKAALFTSSLTPNYNTDLSYSTTNEVSGTGYAAGGVTLASKTLVAATGRLTFDANDPQWTSATFSSVQYVRFYDDAVTSPFADPLWQTLDLGGTFSVTAGTFTVQLSASGIVFISYSSS